MRTPLTFTASALVVTDEKHRSRLTLPFVVPDELHEGIASHWSVPHDPDALYAEGVAVGRRHFEAVASLAESDEEQAAMALSLAMNSPGWRVCGWGIEDGFSQALAEAAIVGLRTLRSGTPACLGIDQPDSNDALIEAAEGGAITTATKPRTSESPWPRQFVAREASALYASPLARCPLDPAVMNREDRLIARAKKALARRLGAPGAAIDSPATVKDFLMLELGEEAREVFCALFLDVKNRVLSFETLFVGTLRQTSVYPREVARRCLELNAAAVVFAHNHPSGVTEPSKDDEALTDRLRTALAMFDVRVLDHFIVGGASCPMSFAERGLL